MSTDLLNVGDIVEEPEDVLSQVVRKQEAALRRLEQKHGIGYGKPPVGSKSEARAKKYNENCVRDFLFTLFIDGENGIFKMRREIISKLIKVFFV